MTVRKTHSSNRYQRALLTVASSLAITSAWAVGALAQDDNPAPSDETTDVITVQGFRQAIESSVASRRNATGVQDAIFAEDIGKFPDLNLAEAMQRIPGVAIQRDNGEGNRVQIRGLGSNFSRVLINDVPASTSVQIAQGDASIGREFDFDVFPSELFTQLAIDKTARASQVEGGVSGTISLRNARPFDFDNDFTLSTSLQGGYNDLSEEFDPRGHVLASATLMDGKFGILGGIAYADRSLRIDAQETLRWTAAGFGCGIPGYTFAEDGAGGFINESGLQSVQFDLLQAGDSRTCQQLQADPAVNLDAGELEQVRLPRLQRTDLTVGDRERTAFTAAAQFRPSDFVDLNVDFFHSELTEEFQRYNLDVELRNQSDLTPVNFVVSPNNTILTGTLRNADRRSENQDIVQENDYTQFAVSGQWRATDWLTVDAKLAMNEVSGRQERQTWLWEVTDSDVTLDYTGGVVPSIGSNVDITDPLSYTGGLVNVDANGNVADGGVATPGLALVRNRIREVDEDSTSFRLDTTFGDDETNLKVGVAYDSFERAEVNSDRNFNGTVAFTEFADGRFLSNTAGTLLLSDVVSGYGDDLDIPSGGVTNHVVANFGALDAHFNGGTQALLNSAIAGSNDRPKVEEDVFAIYGEINTVAEILGRDLRFNAGVRGVNTDQTSTNATSDGSAINISRDYWNLLPSFSVAYDVSSDVVLRLAGGQTMSRPELGQLQASTVIADEGTVTQNNPRLNPFLSDQVDIAAEWYFMRGGLLSGTVFYKQLTGFTEAATETRPFSDSGVDIADLDPAIFGNLNPDTLVEFRTVRNSDEVREVYGLEAIVIAPLDIVTDGLGVSANYTYVESSDVEFSAGATVATSQLVGLSNNLFNITAFYERNNYGVRGSYNWRDDFVVSPCCQGNLPDLQIREASGQFDASAYYVLPGFEDVEITLEGINLTGDDEYTFFGVPERNNRFAYSGRQVLVGVRATF